MTINLAVLASGRGSNLQAIVRATEEGKLDAKVVLVLSDKADAKALDFAREKGIAAVHVSPKDFAQKSDYEAELLRQIDQVDCQLICLAGYMRILSPYFIQNAKVPVMNIHPALLPAFPGLHSQKQALDYGVKIAGCTVHFVDEGMDSGAIILQKSVPVLDDDTEDTLSARILEQEHQAYWQAIQLFAENKLVVEGRTVKIKGE
ncbi:MAG: phosphoribosylglycinamide formyltransferase [Peptococcaceae bacterium]|nr:phosphoribosylglycinamide formyltransferase [Peptococcaceae bacterium]